MISSTNHGYGLAFVDYNHSFTDTTLIKHTYTDFELLMTSLYIPEPEVKRQVVDIPFGSGSVDLTEAAGVVPFADRDGLQFEFFCLDTDPQAWATAMTTLSMYLHGQRLKMRTDYELDYYFVVRLNVDLQKSDKTHSKIVLTGTSEPFKYAMTASHEPWLWDPFNFVNGEIISTADITVSGTTTVTIPAGGIETSPTFIVTQAGIGLGVVRPINPPQTLYMPATGQYRFPQIKAGGASATTITLVGSGRVSVAYRSRYL